MTATIVRNIFSFLSSAFLSGPDQIETQFHINFLKYQIALFLILNSAYKFSCRSVISCNDKLYPMFEINIQRQSALLLHQTVSDTY